MKICVMIDMKFIHLTQTFILVSFFSILSCKKDTPPEPIPEPSMDFQKSIGGAGDQFLNSLVVKDDFIYAFGTNAGVGGNRYFAKLDLQGDLVFGSSIGPGSFVGKEMIATADGNFVATGNYVDPGTSDTDLFVVKFSPDGSVLWVYDLIVFGNDSAGRIAQLSNSDLVVVGWTERYSADKDILVVRLTDNGDFISEQTYGGSGKEGASDVEVLADGSLLIHGFAEEEGVTNQDYLLMKIDAGGDSLWTKYYGGADYEEPNELFITPEGDFVMCGHSASSDPIHDMYCVKVNADGNIIWEKNYGGAAHDGGQAALVNSQGNYVFVARSMSFDDSQATYMVTTDKNGNVIREDIFNKDGADRIDAIVEYDGSYYMVGQTTSFGTGDFDGYVIRKCIVD